MNWVKGSGTDADLLRSLVGESDAVVHSIGLLLDESSGLKNLNFITSGSGSVPGKGATYDSEMRGTAMALMEAAAPSEAKELPFVFVSAAEAGWKDDSLGSKIEAFMEKVRSSEEQRGAKRLCCQLTAVSYSSLRSVRSAASFCPAISRPRG